MYVSNVSAYVCLNYVGGLLMYVLMYLCIHMCAYVCTYVYMYV